MEYNIGQRCARAARPLAEVLRASGSLKWICMAERRPTPSSGTLRAIMTGTKVCMASNLGLLLAASALQSL
ncbi:MAG: hypothetical protein ABSH32_05585 [Bryobacteraceae bacterium]